MPRSTSRCSTAAAPKKCCALGKSLQLRYTPELQWQEDDSIVHGAHILDILSKLDIPEDTEDETADHS